MRDNISSSLKLTFAVHAAVGIILGLGFLFIPAQLGNWFRVPIEADVAYRLVGAAILTFGISSVLGYLQEEFEQIRLILQVEIFWTLVATGVLLWSAFRLEFVPPVAAEQETTARLLLYGSALLMALFFFAFGYFFMTEERPEMTRTRDRDYARE